MKQADKQEVSLPQVHSSAGQVKAKKKKKGYSKPVHRPFADTPLKLNYLRSAERHLSHMRTRSSSQETCMRLYVTLAPSDILRSEATKEGASVLQTSSGKAETWVLLPHARGALNIPIGIGIAAP